MAAETVIVGKRSEAFHWWYLPSWLGLDAPSVVSTWTWAISRNIGARLSNRALAAMFLFVWSIYLLDRLIDVARCHNWRHATGRLHFGRHYRHLFVVCISGCITGIVALLVAGLPPEVVRRAAIVGLGLSLHFLLFVVPVLSRQKLPGKEFGVGLFFALGAYACLGYADGMAPLLLSVALVVAFNCLVIAARDAASDQANDPGGASRWWRTIDRDLVSVGVAFTIAFGLAAVFASAPTFYSSTALAFLLLTVLHACAARFSGDAVRALADFALFTPFLPEAVTAICQS
jgi:hypothetical protein